MFESDVADVTQVDFLEHFLFAFIGMLMLTLYNEAVGLVLIAMSILNLVLTGAAYMKHDNEAFGLIVPGTGDDFGNILFMSVIGLIGGFALNVILGLSIGSTALLIPIIGAGEVAVVGGPVLTSLFLFLSVVVAYPRAEESLWQVFSFTLKEKLEDSFPLFILSILLTSFAFGFFHILTATKLLESFGVPLAQNLLNVTILRLAVTVGAFMYGLNFAKTAHSGFNLAGFMAMVRGLF